MKSNGHFDPLDGGFDAETRFLIERPGPMSPQPARV